MPKVKIALTKMRCLQETDEVGADEPYVLVFAAQIKNVANVVNVPAASTTIYGPWSNVDKGDLVQSALVIGGKTILPAQNCWGLNGKPQELANADEAIFIVALMENDDADTGGIRAGTHAQMFASITSYANAGMSRADMVGKLKHDMKDVLRGITVTGIPNSDDLVGVAELSFSNTDLQEAATQTVVKNIVLKGDGGEYRLRFEMSK
ncbi:MAG: hypothetical protein R2765_06215 [Ferruginibacter sp.]|nr:hypothetical protein [Bacteroidota bacterium]MBX2919918.1 hypothetical protein [Ferruginibacter sp.]MCB0710599.1 hypothetical protein [Chitinophagaceae bacterium]